MVEEEVAEDDAPEEEDPVQVAPGVAQAFWPGPETRMQVEFWHPVWEPQGIVEEQSLAPGPCTVMH